MLLAEMVEYLVAVGARHHQIEQDDLVAVGVDAADGLAAVLRRLHGEAFVLDDSRQQRPNRLVVVDDQCPRLAHSPLRQQEAYRTAARTRNGPRKRAPTISAGMSRANSVMPK